MRAPDYVPVPSAFLMRGRHDRQEFEQPDGIEELKEHRLRDNRAGAGEKVSLMSVLETIPQPESSAKTRAFRE